MSHQESKTTALESKQVPDLMSQDSIRENEEAEPIDPLNNQLRMSIERGFESEQNKNEANPRPLRHAKTPNYLENRKLQEIQDENSRSSGFEENLMKPESTPDNQATEVNKEKTSTVITEEVVIKNPEQNEQMALTIEKTQQTIKKTETVPKSGLAIEGANKEGEPMAEEAIKAQKSESEGTESKSGEKLDQQEMETSQENKKENGSTTDDNESVSNKSQDSKVSVNSKENNSKLGNTIQKQGLNRPAQISTGKKVVTSGAQSSKKVTDVTSVPKSNATTPNASTKKRKFDAMLPGQTPSEDSQLKKVKKTDTPQPFGVHQQIVKTPDLKSSVGVNKPSGVKSGQSGKQMKENIPNEMGESVKKMELNLNAMKLSGLKSSKVCAFCNGGFEGKTDHRMLSCLHKAHNDCYTSMEKKKKGSCPLCDSTMSFVKQAQAQAQQNTPKTGAIKF